MPANDKKAKFKTPRKAPKKNALTPLMKQRNFAPCIEIKPAGRGRSGLFKRSSFIPAN